MDVGLGTTGCPEMVRGGNAYAEHGMRRSRRTIVVRQIMAALAFGLMCMPAVSAEPWYSWRKSPGTSDTASSTAKPAAKRPPATKPATTAEATKPSAANRHQSAPVSASAATEPAAKPWWQLSRKTAKTDQQPGTARVAKPPEERIPVVVKKGTPPPLVVSRQPALPTRTIVADDPHVETTVTLDDPEVLDVVPAPAPASIPVAVNVRPPFVQPTWRAVKGGVDRVVFEEVADPERVPPLPPAPALDGAKGQILLAPNEPARNPKIRLVPAESGDELISLTVRDAPLAAVLSVIAEQHGLNLVSGGEVDGRVTVTLNDVALDDALNALLTVNGYSWHRNRNILVISKVTAESKSSPEFRGVALRVFRLNYISAVDVEKVVQSLLSPAGRAVSTAVDSKDSRRTREELVVEDLPEYLARIETYIADVDRPPRQVLIEAHVLQVNLKDDCRHGVNLQEMFDVSNTKISLSTKGFANPQASPAFFFGIDNDNFHALLEALKVTTDSKTLATPQVLCLNGQHAKIQIGQQLGFLVTTTTQTSTLQNVNFLDVGVVLDVTPTITDEGLVMMQVKPEVSGGQISPAGLPQEDTTEVETTVMLADGSGMIIGGLIKEEDTEVQTKVPYLGDIWLIGRLFQRRTVLRQRNEVIIALVPYIVPYPEDKPPGMDEGVERARTRLLAPPLERMDRRQWEPDLPDAVRNPKFPFSGELKQRTKDPYTTGRPVYFVEE